MKLALLLLCWSAIVARADSGGKPAPSDLSRSSARVCLEKFPTTEVLIERWKDQEPVDAAAWYSQLVDYYSCRALAVGRDTPCNALKGLGVSSYEGVELAEVCSSNFLISRLAKSIMVGGADAARHCVDAIQYFVGHLQCGPPVELLEDSMTMVGYQLKQCALLLENLDSPLRGLSRTASACHGTLRPTGIDNMKFLEGVLSITGADPTCSYQIPDFNASCRSFMLFRRARAAGNAALCELDPICMLMMGQGVRSCEFYAWKLKSSYCTRTSLRSPERSGEGQ